MTDKRYYWLKLHDDYFENANIKIIEAMDNGAEYILFLFKLKLISIKTEGYLRVTDIVPYNEKTLSTVTNTNIDMVRMAMKIFIEFDLIEILEDKTIYVKCIEALMGSESDVAKRVRKHRAKRQLLLGNKKKQKGNTELELDPELEIKKEKNIAAKAASNPVLKKYTDLFYRNYEKKMAVKPKWGGQECKLLKQDMARLAEQDGLLGKCMYHFFKDDLPEVWAFVNKKKAGYSYAVFHGCLDIILMSLRKVQDAHS